MPKVEQALEIAAVPRVLFDVIANQPERMTEWWSAIEVQQRVTPPPTTIGSVSRYVYNMLGVRIKGEHQVIALTQDEHIAIKTISGIDAAIEFTCAPSRGGTRITVRVVYALPGALLGSLLDRKRIEQQNIESLHDSLHALKHIVESEARAG